MSRNAVEGRQAKLSEPHDTTRVVNVSISVSSLSASHRIRPKMQMGEQTIISGVARIWCEGNTKRGVDCEDRDHCRTDGRAANPAFAPKLPTPSSDPCWGFVPGPTGDFCTPNSMRLPS